MARRHILIALVAFLICLPAPLVFTGCGGNGGGGSDAPIVDAPQNGDQTPVTASGEVAVLLADDPAAEYDQLFMTVHKLTLLPDEDGNESAVLFENQDGVEVDLLELREEDYILTVNHEVPAGTYHRIEMEVSEIRPVGGPCDALEVKVPSGKITLASDEPIEVTPGSTLFLRLDVDAEMSFNFHQAGNSGKCIFRPMVFMEIHAGEPPARCPRIIEGTITELFRDDGEVESFIVDLGDDRGDIDVVPGDGVVIFDDDGLPAGDDVLGIGQTVRIRGRLDGDGRLIASAIVIGDILVLDGVATGAVDNGRFPFTPDAEEEIVGAVDVEVADETLILAGCDDPVDPDAIQDGTEAQVFGKYSAQDQVVRAVAILVEPPQTAGELIAIEETGDGVDLTIRTGEDGDATESTVHLPDGAPLVVQGDGDIPVDLIRALLACGGRTVSIVRDPSDPGSAAEVRLHPDHIEGVVREAKPDLHRIDLEDGTTIELRPKATLLDISGTPDRPITLDQIEPGDSIEVFGFTACPNDEVDHYGFIVVVVS